MCHHYFVVRPLLLLLVDSLPQSTWIVHVVEVEDKQSVGHTILCRTLCATLLICLPSDGREFLFQLRLSFMVALCLRLCYLLTDMQDGLCSCDAVEGDAVEVLSS